MVLNSENIHAEPEIINKAANGHYQMVFLSAEMLSTGEEAFKNMVHSKIFRTRLLGVIVDEVHLCHQW